jgi:shikimate 5-dehydrogenase
MTEFLKAGLLGWPVAHSMSPVIHSLFMEEAGIQGEYALFPVRSEDVSALIHALRDRGFTGLNVTVPHKKSVMTLCASLSEEAAISGAVNTLLLHSKTIEGHNTDVQGFKVLSLELPSPFMILGRGELPWQFPQLWVPGTTDFSMAERKFPLQASAKEEQ